MKWTRAGAFKHQLTLWEDRGTGQTASGEHVPSWVAYANTWASIEPFTGKDFWFANQVAGAICSHVIKAYWRPNVKPQDVAVFRGRAFNVGYVFDLEELHREMHLYCTEDLKPVYRFILNSAGDPMTDANGFAILS